ncbi:hypothetical protein Cs7R123_66230 [Catellatospora sp. TT07R-123]|nr:hypothetical protein Cs7R123_66230 [Catellatospora sp. TT07R-123]
MLAWHQAHQHADVYISVLVVGEIRQGVERLRPRKPGQAEVLEQWLDGLVAMYQDRILPVTVEVAQQWGRLNVPPYIPPIVDGLMAATALVHRMTLVTRNVVDFVRTGVPIVNPFDPAQS